MEAPSDNSPFRLRSLLEGVARGEVTVELASDLIEGHIRLQVASAQLTPLAAQSNAPRPQPETTSSAPSTSDESGAHASRHTSSSDALKSALDKFRKKVTTDEFLKVSSGLVSQLTETVPTQIEKLQENLTTLLQPIGFSPNAQGLDAKLTVFRTFHASSDVHLQENSVVGSQWFGVNLGNRTDMSQNKFTTTQFSEFAIMSSEFYKNIMSFVRVSNTTIHNSRFESNRMSRSSLSDFSQTDSDFNANRVLKTEVSQVSLMGSRIANCSLSGVTFSECEFENAEFSNLTFENCTFSECSFVNVKVQAPEGMHMGNFTVRGLLMENVNGWEEFLTKLRASQNLVERLDAQSTPDESHFFSGKKAPSKKKD